MKFLLRVIGTWFLGLAFVLVIIDGVKSLATNSIVVTPLGKTWSDLHSASWDALLESLASSLAPYPQAMTAANFVFGMPSWGVFAMFGLLFLIFGRRQATHRYMATY